MNDETTATSPPPPPLNDTNNISLSHKFQDKKMYAKLFEEGFNSGDKEVMAFILNQLIAEHCIVESSKLIIDSSNNNNNNSNDKSLHHLLLPASREEKEHSIDGKSNVITYFLGYLTAIPDIVFLVHSWKIFQRPSPQHQQQQHACLVFKFSLTGNKVFNIPTKCSYEDEAADDIDDVDISSRPSTNSSSSSPISQGFNEDTTTSSSSQPPRSIKFRERSRTSKYDSRKRGKIFTLGEHVNTNEMHNHLLVNPQDEISNEQLKDEMSQQMMDIDRSDNTGDLLPSSEKVNIQGVMRFYIDEEQKIYKIQCLHIHGH